MDGPVPGYQTVTVEVELEPKFIVPLHSHPGIESTYVIKGEGELNVEGQPFRVVAAGEAFQVPPGILHSVKVGEQGAKACATYVVEKGKPLTLPA